MKKGNGSSGQPESILERSFKFAVRIVTLCGYLDRRSGVPRVLMPQILRAGTSVVSNVEEAQAGQSRADFISKMGIALKEARETHVRLRILSAAALIPSGRLALLINEADEIRRIIGAIIVSAKGSSAPET